MWSLRFSVVVAVVLSLSCGAAPPPSGTLSSTWVAPAILASVPADSPYLVASLEPVNETTRQRMIGGLDQRIAQLLRLADTARGADRSTLAPWIRAGIALADEVRGKDPTNLWRELGFDPSGRFVLYGLSVWPVLRIEVADPARLRRVVERVLSAAGTSPRRGTLDGHAYWSAGGPELTAIAAVLDREAVVAIVPTPTLPTTLPLVLGTQRPARGLGTTPTIPDLFGRYHLMGFMLAYFDARNAIDRVTAPQPSALDAPLRAFTGPVSPACRADLDRLAAIAPRAVFGYRRLDDAGFDGIGIVETAPGVTSALARLRAAVPGVTSPFPGHPLAAMGAAINPDELVSWLRGIATQLHDHPFTCAWLSGINEAGAQLGEQLAAGLPPMWRGVHGFSLVVDDATVLPPSVEGHLLIAGDRIADLVSALSGTVPAIASLGVQPDGRPVAIPTQQLGIPFPSAHLAMLPGRLVVASGPDSARRAADRVALASPTRSPLFVMAFDAPRLQKLLASLGQDSADTLGYLGHGGISLDVASEGIGFDVWGTWREARPRTSPAQPLTQP